MTPSKLTQLAGLLLMLACPALAEEPVPAIVDPPSSEHIAGKFVWADLMTPDAKAAAAFYRDALGWTLRSSADPGYITAYNNGTAVAAIISYVDDTQAPEDAALWLPSFSVEDVDSAMSRGVSAGGENLGAENLAGRGRLGLLRDPQGAIAVLLHSSAGDPPDGRAPVPGQWVWPELWASDAAAAADFYSAALWMKQSVVEDAGGIEHTLLARDKIARASIVENPLKGVEPNWLLYLLVDDLLTTLQRVKAAGGDLLLLAPDEDSAGHIAIIADPTGGVLALQELGGQQP